MEEEKTSRIRLGVLLLICTVSLLGTISLGIVKGTFFNQSFLLEQTKKTEYSQLVANEISQNFREDNLEESEYVEVIATSIPQAFIELSIKVFIHDTYTGSKRKISETTEVTEKIDSVLQSYIQEHQLTLDETEKNKIETMKVTLVNQFQRTAGSYYLFYFIHNMIETMEKGDFLFLIMLSIFLVCQFIIILLSRKNIGRFIRYTSLQLGVVGGVLLIVAGALYLSRLSQNLEFRSPAVQVLMASYIQTVLSYFVISGGIVVSLGVILGLYSFVRYKKKRASAKLTARINVFCSNNIAIIDSRTNQQNERSEHILERIGSLLA